MLKPADVDTRKQLTLKLPESLHRALKIKAAKEGVTLVSLIHNALRDLYAEALKGTPE